MRFHDLPTILYSSSKYCDLVLSDSTTCHTHAATCQRRPPGAEGFFPGNEHWVRAVRTIMCMHTLHVLIWSIPDEVDFRQVSCVICVSCVSCVSCVIVTGVRFFALSWMAT